MSTYANPNKATVYLDMDFFRAPAGTVLPTDPFAEPPVSGTAPGVTWDAFGGLQMGFDVAPTRDVKRHTVANYRQASYAVTTGPLENSLKLKATDRSKATFLTMLEGGSVVSRGAGNFEYVRGNGEEFAILGKAVDITAKVWVYCSRVRLGTPPPKSYKGDELDGWEFELICLDELRDGGNIDPLA